MHSIPHPSFLCKTNLKIVRPMELHHKTKINFKKRIVRTTAKYEKELCVRH